MLLLFTVMKARLDKRGSPDGQDAMCKMFVQKVGSFDTESVEKREGAVPLAS